MILLAFIMLLTVLLSWWAVGRLIPLLSKHQIIDMPNARSLHQGAIPRGGGLVIITILCGALVILAIISQRYAMFGALLMTVLAWSGLSWADDRANLSTQLRWLIQCLFAAAMIPAFGYVDSIQLNANLWLQLGFGGMLATFIGVLWFANLYNFMDGMDGLAASQTIVASITLSVWFWHFGDQGMAIIFMVLASASYGFMLWNWHPARIFMGDVGSVAIGAFFAIFIVLGSTRYGFSVLSFILLFGVFIFDATFTLLWRLLNGEKIWLAHRKHYYQRLAGAGVAHQKIVIAEIMLMLICSLIASITVVYRDTIGLAVAAELILFLLGMWFVSRIESRNNKA